MHINVKIMDVKSTLLSFIHNDRYSYNRSTEKSKCRLMDGLIRLVSVSQSNDFRKGQIPRYYSLR